MVTFAAAGGFVAVDWGSSARRGYALDAAGNVVDQFEDDAGALSVPPGGFPEQVERLRARFGDRPLLMAGMVGSNRGWAEAPYLPCPAGIDNVAARLLWVEPGRTAIVPGLSLLDGEGADVMRGEEVQVFGAYALGLAAGRQTICHPGTHTKWIETEAGVVSRFRTILTGELFALLRKHSILAALLNVPAANDSGFAAGVERGYAGAVLGAELFQVRARSLLRGGGATGQTASFVSGLLIGSDLRAGLADAPVGADIVVLGRGSLTRLYAAAIAQCGYGAREIDGAGAFVAGMQAIRERIG